MATFIATIVIILILVIFVLGSGVIKKLSEVENGLQVYDESDVGINEIFSYLSGYSRLAEVKISIRQGELFDNASLEAGYGG